MGQSWPLFVYFRSLQTQILQIPKSVGFSRIRTLTTTTATATATTTTTATLHLFISYGMNKF